MCVVCFYSLCLFLPTSDDQITCRNEGVGPSKAHFLACEGDTGGNTNTQTVHVSGAGIRMGNGLDHSDSIRSTSSKTSDSSDDFSRTVRTKVEAMLASNNYVGRSDFKGGRAYHGVGVEGSSSSSGSSTPDRVVEPRSNPKGVLVTMHDPDDHTNGEGQRMTSKSPHTVHFDELSFQPLEHSSDNDDADIENSSFEDLEWEAEMLFSNSKTNIAENNDVSELVVNTEIPKIKIIPTVDELQTLRADLEQELQPQCVGENGRPGSPSEVFNVGRNLDHQMEADYLDANDGGDFYRVNNYNSSQFSKMYLPRSDDDESLSVISERTEPMGSDFYDSDISDGSHGSSSSSSTEVDEEQYIQVLVTSKETGKSGAVFEIEKNKAKHFMRGISPHPTKVEVSPVTNSAPVYNLEANIKPKLHNQVDNIIVQTEMLEKRDSITKLAEDAQSLADSSITDGSMTEEDEFSQILEDNRKYVTEAELEEIMSSFTEDPSINSSSDNISINQLSPIDVTHKKKDNIPKSPPAIVIFPETPRGESPDEQYKSPAQSTHVTRGATGGVVKVKKPIRQDSDPVDASHLHHVDEIQKMFEEPPKMMVCHKSPPKEKSVSVLREVPVDTEVLSFNVASPPSHADEENAQLSPSSVETSNVKCGPVVERIDLSVDDTISASQLITVPDDPSVTDRQSSFESVISVPDQFKNNHSAERAVDDSEEYALGGELSAYETVEHAANASPPSGDNQIINNEPCTPPHDHTDAHVYATAILKSSTDSLNSSSSELDVQMPIATGTPISSSEGYYDGLLSSMTEGTPTPGIDYNPTTAYSAMRGGNQVMTRDEIQDRSVLPLSQGFYPAPYQDDPLNPAMSPCSVESSLTSLDSESNLESESDIGKLLLNFPSEATYYSRSSSMDPLAAFTSSASVLSTDTRDSISDEETLHSYHASPSSSSLPDSCYMESDGFTSPCPSSVIPLFTKRDSTESLLVLVDDSSDTAQERANPELLDEDYTLSMSLGPTPIPNDVDEDIDKSMQASYMALTGTNMTSMHAPVCLTNKLTTKLTSLDQFVVSSTADNKGPTHHPDTMSNAQNISPRIQGN